MHILQNICLEIDSIWELLGFAFARSLLAICSFVVSQMICPVFQKSKPSPIYYNYDDGNGVAINFMIGTSLQQSNRSHSMQLILLSSPLFISSTVNREERKRRRLITIRILFSFTLVLKYKQFVRQKSNASMKSQSKKRRK